MGILFAKKLAVIRASLPSRLCLTERCSAICVVFFVWLKNSTYGCFRSMESLLAASSGNHSE